MVFANPKEIEKETQVKEEQETIRIELEPMELKGHIKEHFSSTAELSTIVAKWMKGVFVDIAGSVVYVANDGSFGVDVILRDCGEPAPGQLKAIDNVSEKYTKKENGKGNNIDTIALFKAFNSKKTAHIFDLTEEFKAFISDYIICNNNTRKPGKHGFDGEPLWNKLVTEVYDRVTNNTVVKISGIDVFKILNGLYGKKDESGSKYSYSILTVGPANNVGMTPADMSLINYIIKIRQTTDRAVTEVAAKNNRGVQVGGNTYFYGV